MPDGVKFKGIVRSQHDQSHPACYTAAAAVRHIGAKLARSQ